MRTLLATLIALLIGFPCAAADPIAPIARRLPPVGMELPADAAASLRDRLRVLQLRLQELNRSERETADAAVMLKAVDFALMHSEFYQANDLRKAEWALQQAADRMDAMAMGEYKPAEQRGLLAVGYVSPIDGSVQPYGLEVPERLDLSKPVALYVWLHGRGDKETDLHFLFNRARSRGQLQPANAIVLHPFGRHCMGFKSAGEVDVLDAVADVMQRYPIDERRVVLAGFSMGGAGAWHIGAHYTDRFAAVHAGAGFAETAQYTNLPQEKYPPKWEQTLWRIYDVPNYTRNLFNVPVIAYSGEEDKQIQAARVMEQAFAAEGRELMHLIGPGMGHKYHPDSLRQVKELLAEAVANADAPVRAVHLQTRTLRYGRMHWVRLERLVEHWADTRVDAEFIEPGVLRIETKNVVEMVLDPLPAGGRRISIDGQPLGESDASGVRLVREGGRWSIVPADRSREGLWKMPGLQGPIDDAFLEPFLVVLPGGRSQHAAIQRWMDFEIDHFLQRWRSLYRGEPRIKRDSEVTAEDIERYHLILWGDASSNALLARVLPPLPLRWDGDALRLRSHVRDAAKHVPLMIYPNPLNPQRYIVLNSGPTHREAHDRTNSLQNPKLPDWAIVDVSNDPNDEAPGRIVDAGFFDERWR